MKIYDITVPVREGMPVYSGDQPFKITRVLDMGKGAPANLSVVNMGAHNGTHMDAPLHFIADGKTIGELDLGVMMGPVRVFHLEVEEKIDLNDVETLDLEGVERVIFKTRNSDLWRKEGFQTNYVYISGRAAQYLVDRGVKLVGVDYLSVQAHDGDDFSPHLALLGGGVVVLEGVDLSETPPGDYRLVALPLKLVDAEGAPARAVLIEE